jgi:hypothetical protein
MTKNNISNTILMKGSMVVNIIDSAHWKVDWLESFTVRTKFTLKNKYATANHAKRKG